MCEVAMGSIGPGEDAQRRGMAAVRGYQPTMPIALCAGNLDGAAKLPLSRRNSAPILDYSLPT
jgi:hypothetical protein